MRRYTWPALLLALIIARNVPVAVEIGEQASIASGR
jgi:hypothetical protein